MPRRAGEEGHISGPQNLVAKETELNNVAARSAGESCQSAEKAS